MSHRATAGVFVLLGSCMTNSNAEELRDPTRPPPVAAKAAVPDVMPVLSAIIGAGNDRVAVVNGQVVHAGDSVAGYRIEIVLAQSVRCRHAGVTLDLVLPRTLDVKTRSGVDSP